MNETETLLIESLTSQGETIKALNSSMEAFKTWSHKVAHTLSEQQKTIESLSRSMNELRNNYDELQKQHDALLRELGM